MTSIQKSQWPGHEVSDPMLRAVARSAVRQGWRYEAGTLYPPGEGKPVVLPQSLQWRAQRRALVQLQAQGVETVRPSYDAAPPPDRVSKPVEVKSDAEGLLDRLKPRVRSDATGDGRWTLADARKMVRDGYDPAEVSERTGWGSMWLT